MRTAEELVNDNVPYKEMEEEEIAAVVEYKAAIIARDTVYEKRTEAQREFLTDIIAQREINIAKSQEAYDRMKQLLGLGD